uniref:Protein TAPT1 homolog n=1 Tax=Meloidogyne floridensis TaxID=298350 RepID=A0A915NEX6_9BILA
METNEVNQHAFVSDECSPLSSENLSVRPRKLTLFEFMWMEISRGYSLQDEQDRYTEKRKKVHAFIRIPLELERFIFFGLRQCLDAFCHMFTFLPLRIIVNFFGCLSRTKNWTAADTCDILKVVIIVCSCWFMQFADTSMMYHLVRGQGVIKLYIFYNMLEVADKLFSSFGQDTLDALFWTVSERGERFNFLSAIFHLFMAIVYALCHTLLILLQFGKPNLFQMSCSDVRERFHTVVLLLVVVLRNMTAVNWKLEHLYEMTPDLIMIIAAELMVDWLKHAFITKFNEISSQVYRDFTITLAFDVLRSHQHESFSDFSDQVSRRMGFVPIPIAIMLIRVVSQSVNLYDRTTVAVISTIWITMLFIKIVNGVLMHSKAVDQVIGYSQQLAAQEEFETEECDGRKPRYLSRSMPGSPHMSLYDFSDVLTQTAKKAPIIRLQRNSSKQDIDEELRIEEPPRRSQSVGNFVRQETDENAEGNENNLSGIYDKTLKSDRDEETQQQQRRMIVHPQEELANIQAYSLLENVNQTTVSTSTSDLRHDD